MTSLARLKQQIARIERQCPLPDARSVVPTGHAAIDAALGGGLRRGSLHEAFAESADAASAAGFAAMLARRCGGPAIWIRETKTAQQLYGEGLAEIGLDPACLILCAVPDAAAALKAAHDAVHCPQSGVVVIELWRRARAMTLTVSRRLALAAEKSGVTPILVQIDVAPQPSAATTRWAVRSAPSIALAGNAPGWTALDLELLRQRGRAGEGRWTAMWDADDGRFVPAAGAALSRDPLAVPALRPVARDLRRAA
jgi:protein ImuA